MENSLPKQKVIGVILAAGQGKRMNSDLPKVAHSILNRPMVHWVMDSMYQSGVDALVVVVSPVQPLVEKLVNEFAASKGKKAKLALQTNAKGTAHAVSSALDAVSQIIGEFGWDNPNILIGAGDTPAVSISTYQALQQFHAQGNYLCSLLSFITDKPTGYGRIKRDSRGNFELIREEKDCSADEKLIQECNSGLMCVQYKTLAKYLPEIDCNNSANEYYLTDLPIVAKKYGAEIGVCKSVSGAEIQGVNTQEQLRELEQYMMQRK